MSSEELGQQDALPWSDKWVRDVGGLDWDFFVVRVKEQTEVSWLRKLSCFVVEEHDGGEITRRIRLINRRIDELEDDDGN